MSLAQGHRVFYGVKRTGTTLMDRILGADGTPVSQATFTAIAYTVTDLETHQRIGSGSLTIALVIFDGLQNDALWAVAVPGDTTGYNFRWTVPANLLSGVGRRVQVDVKMTPTSGEIFWLGPYFLDLEEVHP